jgi:hypothetical protein
LVEAQGAADDGRCRICQWPNTLRSRSGRRSSRGLRPVVRLGGHVGLAPTFCRKPDTSFREQECQFVPCIPVGHGTPSSASSSPHWEAGNFRIAGLGPGERPRADPSCQPMRDRD